MTTHSQNTPPQTVQRCIECGNMIAVLDVPVIYSAEDPYEPLLEAKTMKFLDEAQRRADAGDLAWLRQHGSFYHSIPA